MAIRDIEGYADLIDEVFTAAGFPFACELGLVGSRLGPAKALVNLLTLELEDWPYARLMSLLDSNFFQPDWDEFENRRAVRDVAAELRHNQIEGGRERMIGALERIAVEPASNDPSPTGARAKG